MTPIAYINVEKRTLEFAKNIFWHTPTVANLDRIPLFTKEVLAQPEQEPVAWHTEDHLTDRSATTYSKDMVYRWECKGWPVTPLYATPPQRTWVGLTEQERNDIEDYCEMIIGKPAFDAIEDKLKQKNGFAEENT